MLSDSEHVACICSGDSRRGGLPAQSLMPGSLVLKSGLRAESPF